MQLAETSLQQSAARQWAVRVTIAVGLAAAVFALAVVARTLIGQPDAPRRQIAKIAILPDTPPPPPPPPREEPKKIEPRPEQRQQPQPEQPRPVQAPPAEAPIKMEGPAGDGPSAFAAGAITQDYKGGTPSTAPAAAPPAVAAVDRANERFYANTARQMLRDELQRQLKADAGELVATLSIWVEPDGQIRRFELQPSGQPDRDAQMQAALEATTRSFRLPPPPPVAQPMRFRVTLRPQG